MQKSIMDYLFFSIFIVIYAIGYAIFFIIKNIFWILPLLSFVFMVYLHFFPAEKVNKRKHTVSNTGSGLCDNYYDRAIDGSLCGNRASNTKRIISSASPNKVSSASNPVVKDNNSITDIENKWINELSSKAPELLDLFSDKSFINYINSNYENGEKYFDFIADAIAFRDVSKLPRIRVIIDEYYNQLSNNNTKLAFTCSLNDNRNVFVTARDKNYIYTIFDKSGKNIELTFSNTQNQVQNNSLQHRNGITLIMQNKTYQYRISNQGNKTTIFVYNGDKGISTHYCQTDKTFWDISQLPALSANIGSICGVLIFFA